MGVAIITGSAGLIGSEAVRFFSSLGMDVVGIDNDMRKFFFGEEASTRWNRQKLEQEIDNYEHRDVDIRDYEKIKGIFQHFGNDISLIIHTAAQPSHDWAASDPFSDFTVNANGTLNLLQATREFCPDAVFIFTSTNKVYGDLPNALPLIELEKRWEINETHEYHPGIPETMSIDQCKHSLFGASKVAADVLVQEYGRYFGIRTASFRGGCLTGPNHSGTELHGFLAYLVKCTAIGKPYTIYGYKGKQVRDNIHSSDLIAAFYQFYLNPRVAEVYNIGGGRESNCSMLEAIAIAQELAGRKLDYSYTDNNRSGDHIWYVSDLSKFKSHYPKWNLKYNINQILTEIYESGISRWNVQ
ncbi:MAG: NAD-dependent epimerase/dehydratase family protein [Cyanobacteria bacterium J06621_8]